MHHPKVVFDDTVELRSQYLTYLAKQITCRYYQDRRFLVLPRLVSRNSRTIYFPDLAYPAGFWRELSRYSQDDFDYFFPPRTVDLVRHLLPKKKPGRSIEKLWRAKEKPFFDAVRDSLPGLCIDNIAVIKVLPCDFGSVSSFYFEKSGNQYNFYHTLRSDFGPAQLAETILTQILWTQQPIPKLTTWYQKEAIVDFLMTKSRLGKIFEWDYQPTVSGLPDLPSSLVTESEHYLSRLGFPLTSILGLDSDRLTLSGQLLGNTFTPAEKRVLTGLISNKNNLLTYDRIGDLFWGEGETSLDKFNLASIAKLIEKIRKKIKDHGVYQELIYTVRGQGYVLYD